MAGEAEQATRQASIAFPSVFACDFVSLHATAKKND